MLVVYLDDPRALSVYHERLQRDHGAQLVRLRYYGPREPSDGNQQIFVERKTHKEKWSGERSIKVGMDGNSALGVDELLNKIHADELSMKDAC
jgi:SPX domain protein involved in polyphosphate accumulation